MPKAWKYQVHIFDIIAGHLQPPVDGAAHAVKGIECDGDEAHLSECEVSQAEPCDGAAAVSCYNSKKGRS